MIPCRCNAIEMKRTEGKIGIDLMEIRVNTGPSLGGTVSKNSTGFKIKFEVPVISGRTQS